jgi:hypothetical protein
VQARGIERLTPPQCPAQSGIESACCLRFREIYDPADEPLVLVARRLVERLGPFDVGSLEPIDIKGNITAYPGPVMLVTLVTLVTPVTPVARPPGLRRPAAARPPETTPPHPPLFCLWVGVWFRERHERHRRHSR